MKREEVMNILAAHRDELRAFGVERPATFGSVARDEARPDSDVDMLVEFNQPTGYFGLFRLQRRLEELLGTKVDLSTFNGIKPRFRDSILAEAICVA